jgi:hypothetical protein
VQSAANLQIISLRTARSSADKHKGVFISAVAICALSSALLASTLPLSVSVVTVFLFAGPHNWFEFRYFLMRLPVRFGRSRNFFLVAFAGIAFLTMTYVSLPFVFDATFWSNEAWLTILATWNTLLLLWLAVLVWLRSKQKVGTNWSWVFPVVVALSSLNWLGPEFFSLALVYLHPVMALWFLDRHLVRTRPTWLRAYRRCLALVPLVVGIMIWQLFQTSSLIDDNGLFWRITQHSGAQLLPGVSSHLLVSVHLFLEMLHYAVWLLALPLIGPIAFGAVRRRAQSSAGVWTAKSVPIARHPRGFPKTIATLLVFACFIVGLLWFGFSFDYARTRDIYFTVAIAHVLAEAPFLLKMM